MWQWIKRLFRAKATNDRERWIHLLDDMNIGFELESHGAIHLEPGMSNVEGYTSFYCDVCFNEDGSFRKVYL